MSRPEPQRLPSSSKLPGRRTRPNRLASISDKNAPQRRTSVSAGAPGAKNQRTSKTSQKLVVLPSAPQTKPLLADAHEDLTLGYETDAGAVREYKSEAERMSKEQRHRAGYQRLTAYCVAESFNMKLMASYLKREHNVSPRVFDEALYVVRYLKLCPFRILSYLCRCITSHCCLATTTSQISVPQRQSASNQGNLY